MAVPERIRPRNAWIAMPSRCNRRLRCLFTIALTCLYLFVAAGVSINGAHARVQSACHGHGDGVARLTSLPDSSTPGPSNSAAVQSPDGGAADHFDFGCQFCSAIVNHPNTVAPRLFIVSTLFQDRNSSLFGQSRARPPRPPQSFIAF
jgi:hypothetical protein